MEFYTTKYINDLIKKDYFNFIEKYYIDILSNPNKYIHLVQGKISDYLWWWFVKLVDSWTTALQFWLLSLWVWKWDEVILPPNTYSATAIAITNIWAIPVFCDIDLDNYTLSISDLKKRITNKTKVIIPVHLYWYNCNMKAIIKIAEANNLKILEDASHCFWWEYFWEKLWTIWDIWAFSCHLSKNFWTFWNGWIFFTKEKKYLEKIENFMFPDNKTKEVLSSLRTPSNIWTMDSLVLLFKLKYIDKIIDYNILLYNDYLKKYSSLDLKIPKLDFLNNKLHIRNFTALSTKRDFFIEKWFWKQFYDTDLSKSPTFSKFYLWNHLENTQVFFNENISFSFYFWIK